MGEKYYYFVDIAKKFEPLKNYPATPITESEFLTFCIAIRELPKDIIDSLIKEVYFVCLSAGDGDSAKTKRGVYVNLGQSFLNKKKGIIVLSSYALGAGYCNEERKIEIFYLCTHNTVLHEAAHYFLEQTKSRNEHEMKAQEEKACQRAEIWHREYWAFYNGLQPGEKKLYDP